MPFEANLTPPPKGFSEIWHAQVLAMADTLTKAGVFEAEDWAQYLGAALKAAEARGDPDTEDTYYHCALTALENLCQDKGGLSAGSLLKRKDAWVRAYTTTPHGAPVVLADSEDPVKKDSHDH